MPWSAWASRTSGGAEHDEVLVRNVPVRRIRLADGSEALVATVYDLQMANYSIDRGLGGDNVAASYEDADVPYTPAWQERITGVPARARSRSPASSPTAPTRPTASR